MHRLIETRLMAVIFLQSFRWPAPYATGGNETRVRGFTEDAKTEQRRPVEPSIERRSS
jgi:hypothetical protein